MAEADALVEQRGADGRHPDIQSAAAMVASAHATRDMETLHVAIAEFKQMVRVVAVKRINTAGE